MTRIKYLLLTAICLVCAQAYGQSLLVYHVVGQVSYRVNGVSKPLVMNTKVTAQTSITVPYGGKVELLNEQSKQRVTIKQPGQGTIKQLSAARGNSVSQLSGKYIAYVKKQLGNKNLVSQKRYTDFVTVTRELDSVAVAAPKQELSFAYRFNQFKKQSEQKYLSRAPGVGAIWRRASREASRRTEGGASGLSRHVGHIEVFVLRPQEEESQREGRRGDGPRPSAS